MRFSAIRKWLLILASGGCVFASGCPDAGEIQNTVADSVAGLVESVIGLYVDAGVNAFIGT